MSVEGAVVGPLAVAAKFIIVAVVAVLYDPGIVTANDFLEIRHAAVAELDSMQIQDLL